MEKEKIIYVDKPNDWPQNQREAKLNNVLCCVKKFKTSPNYINKEILLSLLSELDPNQYDSRGKVRIHDYEVALINELYYYAQIMNLSDLKIFLYKQITETTRAFNIISKMPEYVENVNDIDKYANLILPLKFYYISFKNYNYFKERSFCEELLDTINSCERFEKEDILSLNDIEYGFVNLMNDLSCSSGINTLPIIEFSRSELLKLFEKEFNIIKQVGKNPNERPLKGVLKMTIANWILKSRNNYNKSPVFKCLTNIASNSSVINHEVWMQSICFLNDKRENKTIKEIFSNKKWINYEWAKKVVINNPYTFYVTSFSKAFPNENLKHKYGKNVYGFRSDKIANTVAPIIKYNNYPILSQTLSFDVIYDRKTAKCELNYLFKIINLLPLSNEQKTQFTNEIISYWCLSFKDKKWQCENERRYQIFFYDNYSYIEVNKDERFIKIKSSLFLSPDNISNNNNQFNTIKANLCERYYSIATKEFIQCNDCLNIDFEIFGNIENYVCPICGSVNYTLVDPIFLKK